MVESVVQLCYASAGVKIVQVKPAEKEQRAGDPAMVVQHHEILEQIKYTEMFL